MDDRFYKELCETFAAKSSRELRSILAERETGDWAEEAIAAVSLVLAGRSDDEEVDEPEDVPQPIGQSIAVLSEDEIGTCRAKMTPPPESEAIACPSVGDRVWVSDMDLCHGTFTIGGRATVDAVWTSMEEVYISVAEIEGASWAWSHLSGLQEDLRKTRPNAAGRTMIRMYDGTIEPFGD